MRVNMEEKLRALPQTADEMFSGLTAAPVSASQLRSKKSSVRAFTRSAWLKVAVPVCAAAVLVFVFLLPQFTADNQKVPRPLPAVESIAAGNSTAATNIPARADIPIGSVTLSGGSTTSFRNLFAGSSITSFPMIQLNGACYRMLNEPQTFSQSYLGNALGKVSAYTSAPTGRESGIVSNAALEGETVYEIQSMSGAAVAARVNGSLRVFQRVSRGSSQAIPSSLGTLLGNARATGIVLSGVGQVTDSSAVKRLLKTLSSKSTYLSDNCSSTSQGLYITLENGITLQFYISGNTLMSCGAWSCSEFLDEFRQIAR